MKLEAAQGVPKTVIARNYGVSRQTVYNTLNSRMAAEPPVRPSKLDAFKDYITGRLEHYDLPATVLLREIQELGYAGGITILKEFVRTQKSERMRAVIERFETLPGQQAQLDWAECGRITVNGKSRKLYVFIFVLGYSRMLFAKFTTSMKQPILLACLRAAFEELGVPRELLIDNMKTAVEKHSPDRTVRFNSVFLDFCEHYGTLPIACPPYWPRAKGKVENAVNYIKKSFLLGREFITVEDLNEQLQVWLTSVANVRKHGTTRERPVDRYAHEQQALRTAAAVPVFDTRELLIRKVQPDSHVRVAGSAYSVPPNLVGHMVHVRIQQLTAGNVFEVIHNGKVLALHTLTKPGERITTNEHAAAIKIAARESRKPTRPKNRYRQIQTETDRASLLQQVHVAVPVVQTRSLAEYEQFLEQQ